MLIIMVFINWNDYKPDIGRYGDIISSTISYVSCITFTIAIAIQAQYLMEREPNRESDIELSKCVFISNYTLCGAALISWITFGYIIIQTIYSLLYLSIN